MSTRGRCTLTQYCLQPGAKARHFNAPSGQQLLGGTVSERTSGSQGRELTLPD